MPTLVTIPFSHFCEKARWALEYARVRFREEGHVPGMHRFAVGRARGRGGSVPVLVLEDRGVLDDSPLIVRWADHNAPADRKLLPASRSPQYAEALALERHLDVELAPHVRRVAYFHLLPHRERLLELMGIATPPLEHAIARTGFPLLRVAMRRAMRIDEGGAARSLDKVRSVFDEIGRRLSDGRPYLLGDRFGVADVAFAAFAAPLLAPPEHPFPRGAPESAPPALAGLASEFQGTPGGVFALRVYRERREPGPN